MKRLLNLKSCICDVMQSLISIFLQTMAKQ